jgi:hypothetical protein
VNTKRRNSRLFSIEKHIVRNAPLTDEPDDLRGIDLELMTCPELEELLNAVKVLDRFRLLHASLSPTQHHDLREQVLKNPKTPCPTEYYNAYMEREAAKKAAGEAAG